MASGSDATPPHRHEKRSKHNHDPAASSWLTRRNKASCPRDAAGVRGRGRSARARGTLAQGPPPLVGAAAREFIPGIEMCPLLIRLRKPSIKKAGLLLMMCAP